MLEINVGDTVGELESGGVIYYGVVWVRLRKGVGYQRWLLRWGVVAMVLGCVLVLEVTLGHGS